MQDAEISILHLFMDPHTDIMQAPFYKCRKWSCDIVSYDKKHIFDHPPSPFLS